MVLVNKTLNQATMFNENKSKTFLIKANFYLTNYNLDVAKKKIEILKYIKLNFTQPLYLDVRFVFNDK